MLECINIQEAKQLLSKSDALLVDIRDIEDYNKDYDPLAFHLTNENLYTFITATSKSKPIIVMCYHGNSSKDVSRYLIDKGFEKIYSLEGGYEKWKNDI